MDPRFQINWLAAQFAQRLNAALQLLNDSYLLEKPEIEEALFSDRHPRCVELRFNLTWVSLASGLGFPDFHSCILLTSTRERIGTVGDVCSRLFDGDDRS
jgi:DNA-binding transcriptional regulator LsrR (DeoR family)